MDLDSTAIEDVHHKRPLAIKLPALVSTARLVEIAKTAAFSAAEFADSRVGAMLLEFAVKRRARQVVALKLRFEINPKLRQRTAGLFEQEPYRVRDPIRHVIPIGVR